MGRVPAVSARREQTLNRLDRADPEHWLMHAESDEDFWGETCTCEIGHDHWADEDTMGDAPEWTL